MLRGLLSTFLLTFLASLGPLPARDSEKSEAKAEPRTPNAEQPRNAQNLLADSKSPYLLQHADNPVHWQPWGDEAFALARKENKPVFLSIGYSTCHWCHVMAHESFEDQATADFLNEHFVSIKMDREERPDVDRIYMNYQQAVHGGGGWPLSVWLTPDRVPFFSGTYFPKDARPGSQVTFMSMLSRIRESWSQYSTEISEDSSRILKRLDEVLGSTSPEDAAPLDPALSRRGFEDLSKIYDESNAGFGGAPKFPQPVNLTFLLDYHASLDADDDATREARDRSLAMVHSTLRKMYDGGIHDHLAGGFHRYSVDDHWHVPHFEKMLYDQAQIASAAIDAHHLTRNPLHREIVRDIFAYVERDLSHPSGAFYSAEDADSLIPSSHQALAKSHDASRKSEGAFYLWTHREISEHLGPDLSPLFLAAYDVEEESNVPPASDPFKEFNGRNILRRVASDAELAKIFNRDEAGVAASLEEARSRLLALRSKRPRPHLDDKILTAWNALMISAYAKAAVVLDDEKHLDRAIAAATFIRENLYDAESKTLLRAWRDGPSEARATADDYAFLVQALLDIHAASLDVQWLLFAVELQDRQIELLIDDEHGGFFDSPATQTDLILRLKSVHDGARPSANAISAQNLIRLGALVKSERYQSALDDLFRHFGAELTGAPVSHSALLTAWARHQRSPAQILVTGSPSDPSTTGILAEIHSRYLPGSVLLLLPPEGPAREVINALNPQFAAFTSLEGRPTLYLCRNFTCQKPTSDPEEISRQLDAL